jgi:hypothetical protein
MWVSSTPWNTLWLQWHPTMTPGCSFNKWRDPLWFQGQPLWPWQRQRPEAELFLLQVLQALNSVRVSATTLWASMIPEWSYTSLGELGSFSDSGVSLHGSSMSTGDTPLPMEILYGTYNPLYTSCIEDILLLVAPIMKPSTIVEWPKVERRTWNHLR